MYQYKSCRNLTVDWNTAYSPKGISIYRMSILSGPLPYLEGESPYAVIPIGGP